MSGSLRPINLGVPDITVVVRENSDANKVLVDVPNISVNIEKLPDYKVSVQPSSVVIQRTGSLPLLAVSALNANTASYALAVSGSIDTAVSSSYALTASYAQNAGAASGFPFSGSAVITGSLLFVDTGNVGGITGSLLGTASVADAIDIIFAGGYQTGSDAPIALQVGGTGNVVSASYALTASYAANMVASVSASFATTASYALNATATTPAGTVSSSAQYPGWVTASSQIDYNSVTNKLSGVISSSAQFNTLTGTSASFATTASAASSITFVPTTASFATTASYVSALSGGARGYIPLWASNTSISSSGLLYQTASNLILGDGTTFFDETNPDKLGIYAGRTNSFNLVSAHANNNNYLQINIRNFSTGSNSSADIVATYDTGTEDTGYINMGINGTSYVGANIHDVAGDGYIFTTGSNLVIGTATPNSTLSLFAGGESYSDGKLRLKANGQHQLTGSLNINSGSFVGNVIGTSSWATSASTVSTVGNGTQGYLALWASNTSISSSGLLYQTASSLILGDGTTFFDEQNPDKLGIYAGRTTSFNLISAHGNTDNYLQVNVRNFSTGSNASSDIVATTDTGTETSGYINMGINSTTYVGDAIHDYPGDGYLITTGSQLLLANLVLGSATSGSSVILFAGGEHVTDEKLRLKANNQHQLTGSLNTSGSQNVLGNVNVTGSLTVSGSSTFTNIGPAVFSGSVTSVGGITGSFSGSLSGTITSASFATTASAATSITFTPPTASFATTASFALNAGQNIPAGTVSSSTQIVASLPAGTVSSSAQINTGSFSGSFTGSLTGTITSASYAITSSYALSAIAITPAGTVSSSAQYPGWVTSSTQIVNSLPAGTVSSSIQISSITASLAITGSNTFVGNQIISGALTVTSTASFNGNATANDVSLLLTNSSSLILTSGSSINVVSPGSITGSVLANEFILPIVAPATPQTGSMYFSGSFIYVYTGTQYRSASLA